MGDRPDQLGHADGSAQVLQVHPRMRSAAAGRSAGGALLDRRRLAGPVHPTGGLITNQPTNQPNNRVFSRSTYTDSSKRLSQPSL